MSEHSKKIPDGPLGGPQFRDACDQLIQIVLDGLRHGHFRCSISSGIGKEKKRELVIEAGKSHKFTIPEYELPRGSKTTCDPCDGDAKYETEVKSSVIGGIPRSETKKARAATSRA